MMSVEYVPPSKEKINDNNGCYWHENVLVNDCDVQNEIKNLINKKFNFNVNNFVQTTYTMVGANDMPRPHTDEKMGVKYQCLIFMHGEESTNNGTGFYHKTETGDYELSIHVGFKQNRATFFSSDVFHSPLQWAGNGSFRYSICNFFN
tara:strand:+ start:88 stop:531 length:444 start_codon:yes stop_codon:yes gene_type:complete